MANAALIVGIVLLVVLVLFFSSRTRDKKTGPAATRTAGKRRARSTAERTPEERRSSAAPERGGVFEIGEREPVEWGSPVQGVPDSLRGFHLRSIEELNEDDRQRVHAMCAAMPEPHPIQARIAGGLDSPEELKEAVATDAGLTASVLRTVNSAAFALASPITSVQHAITYLGVSVVKGIVVQAAVAKSAPADAPERPPTLERVWKAARVSSAVAQMIGQEFALPRPSVLSTSALFANIGDVAIASQRADLDRCYGGGSTLLARIDAQQDAFGANTFLVGSVLSRHWDLPDSLSTTIEQAGLPLATPPVRNPLQGDALRANLIVYSACRVGDAVAYQGLRQIEELVLKDSDDPNLYYLEVYLRSAGLGRLLGLFEEPGFRRKANRLIGMLAS